MVIILLLNHQISTAPPPFSSRQYLCDGSETCLPHAIELCLSRYCSLGGMAQSEVEDGSSLESKVIRDLDNLPMAFINTFQVL